ncbi:MAG: RNA-binding domain-containing protein [Chlamydiales bacterium]
MNILLNELQELLQIQNEHERIEFKEAKSDFSLEKTARYCAALSNEGGGKLILGITDQKPRKIVGTQAFIDLNRCKLGLTQKLRLRVEVQEMECPQGRVLVFHVPPRPRGDAIEYEGAYWMRAGESLVPMTKDMLKRIFAETDPDFSEQICKGATIDHLDPEAIEKLRSLWIRKSGNDALARLPIHQLLSDAELVRREGVTYAALILLGKNRALRSFLPQGEVVFEYRFNEEPGPAQQRIEFTKGFLLYFDELWQTINLRNDKQHFQDGFVVLGVPTFNEKAVREAVLNAVAHRDYRSAGSVFVRQFPRKIEIQSPGGLPDGITPENILWKQHPRNRRVAEIFLKCGLVERSGQGANLIFKETICQGKSLPNFDHTDATQVFLTLPGDIQDPSFLRFLEKIGQERLREFSIEDFLILDLIQREEAIPSKWQSNVKHLIEAGILEKHGRGRGVRCLFSRRYYSFIGKSGAYTRKRGLDRETNKELLLKHIVAHTQTGSRLQELMQVLPMLSKDQVQKLVKELKLRGTIFNKGTTRSALWYPVSIAPK